MTPTCRICGYEQQAWDSPAQGTLLGWTAEGRALAGLGWRPDMQWGPAGVEAPSVHGRRGDLGSEG